MSISLAPSVFDPRFKVIEAEKKGLGLVPYTILPTIPNFGVPSALSTAVYKDVVVSVFTPQEGEIGYVVVTVKDRWYLAKLVGVINVDNPAEVRDLTLSKTNPESLYSGPYAKYVGVYNDYLYWFCGTSYTSDSETVYSPCWLIISYKHLLEGSTDRGWAYYALESPEYDIITLKRCCQRGNKAYMFSAGVPGQSPALLAVVELPPEPRKPTLTGFQLSDGYVSCFCDNKYIHYIGLEHCVADFDNPQNIISCEKDWLIYYGQMNFCTSKGCVYVINPPPDLVRVPSPIEVVMK